MAKVRRFATSAACLVMGNRLAGDSKKGGDYSSTCARNRTVEHIEGGRMLPGMGTFCPVETSTPLLHLFVRG
jgi:hypothetical protein